MLGTPRAHYAETDSTNARARDLAAAGAPHGTLVTAAFQTAGRGRQGRTWLAEPGDALLCSYVLRAFDGLLSLRAGLAVADIAGPGALVKWPNDVLLDGLKVAGVLVEGRPQEGWAVLGIGVNVRSAPMGASLGRNSVSAVLDELTAALERRLGEEAGSVLAALRGRDALLGRPVTWSGGSGVGAGISDSGALRVELTSGETVELDAGEVHLGA
jgi:BirA family biotin operon repressor/biotin-[acetyl-CoA-carboxylase] ligase